MRDIFPESVLQIFDEVGVSGDLNQMIASCSHLISEHFSANTISIFTFGSEGMVLHLIFSHNLNDRKGLYYNSEEGIAFTAMKKKREIYIEDIDKETNYDLEGFNANGICSLCCVPLKMGEEVIGVIYLGWKVKYPLRSIKTGFFNGLINILTILVMTKKLRIKDSETGLYNKIFFIDTIMKEIMRSSRYRLHFSLIRISIDNLSLNSVDQIKILTILREIAKLLKKVMRKTDCLGRIDTNLFACLLIETGPLGTRVVSERIKTILEEDVLKKFGLIKPIENMLNIDWISYSPEDMSSPKTIVLDVSKRLHLCS